MAQGEAAEAVKARSLARYGVAILAAAIGLLVRHLMTPEWRLTLPYITLFPAVAFSAWFGGFGPGMTTTCLTAAGAWYLWLPSMRAGDLPDVPDALGLGLFCLIGLFMSTLTEALQRAQRRTEQTSEERNRLLTQEKNLARDARLLAAIVDSSDDAIISKDLNGIVTSWNHAAERMYGYSAREAIGQSIRLIIPADRQDEEDQVLDRIRRGEPVQHFETVRRHKDGTLLPVALTVSPVRDTAGVIIGASKIARDIRERKRAEAQAQRASRQTAFLARIAAVLGTSLDYEHALKAVANLAVPEIADWCAIDIEESGEIRRVAVAHIDPSKIGLTRMFPERYDDPTPPCSVPHIVRTGTPTVIPEITEEVIASSTPGGREYLRLIRELGLRSFMCLPLVAHGRTVGALSLGTGESGRSYTEEDIGFAEDVASRTALAVENARAYLEVQKANRLKDEFLATLSHELRTPLNAILGYARMLRSGMMKGEKVTGALETVERNATSLTQIVEDVLDVSRIVSGKIRLNVQPVELQAVVRNAAATVHPAADAKGLRIETVIDPRVGPVSGDPDRLQQVVWNLLANAVKFTPRHGRVQIRLEQVNSHVEIVVSDTGIGIPEGFLPYIFERFRQAEGGTTRQHPGLGLGLAIARHIVEMHGGTIHAASGGEGKGATFRVQLPVMIVHREQPVEERRVHPRSERPAASTIFPSLQGARVLAVDDDADALVLLREVLESAGAHVMTAGSATEALDAVQALHPDVLVADLGMPTVDGFELIARIRRAPDEVVRDIPAAALTAYARSEDRAKTLRSGFEMHLAKPIDPAELVAAVAALARRRVRTPSPSDKQ
jgi:PAS domain S-box-containing protein